MNAPTHNDRVEATLNELAAKAGYVRGAADHLATSEREEDLVAYKDLLEAKATEALTSLLRIQEAAERRAGEGGGIGELFTRKQLLRVIDSGNGPDVASALMSLVQPTDAELEEIGE